MTEKTLPCGHPEACTVQGKEGTGYCGWCEEISQLKSRAERLSDSLADTIGDEVIAAFQEEIKKRRMFLTIGDLEIPILTCPEMKEHEFVIIAHPTMGKHFLSDFLQ